MLNHFIICHRPRLLDVCVMRVTWLWDWWDSKVTRLSHQLSQASSSTVALKELSRAYSLSPAVPSSSHSVTAAFAIKEQFASVQSGICSNTSDENCLLKKPLTSRTVLLSQALKEKESFDRWKGSSTLKPWQKQERLTFTGDPRIKT